MKILITGVFSCGKTTLVERLCQDERIVRSIGAAVARNDPARLCVLPLNKAQTIHTSIWLAGTVLTLESELEARGADLIICDRGLPDIVSHTYGHTTDVKRQSGLIQMASWWSKTYAHIFRAHANPEIPVELDSLRMPSQRYRSQMDDLLTRALKETGTDVLDLPHSLEQRVDTIVDTIARSTRAQGS